MSKCIVHGCSNRMHQGDFVGDICRPCYNHLTTGKVGPTNTFLKPLQVKRVKIHFWRQDTMESGHWETTMEMTEANAEDLLKLNIYESGRIIYQGDDEYGTNNNS